MNPEGTDLLQTRLRETETKCWINNETENKPLSDSDNIDSDEDDNGGSESSSDEENENDYVERPATTRSGRAITRRSEIWFLSFQYFFQRIQSELAHFFFAEFVVYSSLLYTTKSAKKKFILLLHLSLSESDRCNCSLNCNTLIMPKTYCVTVQYVYLV